MITFQVAIKNPEKMFAPVRSLIDVVVMELLFDKLVVRGDVERAVEGMAEVLPDLLKWKFVADSHKNLAAIRFELIDDEAARTMLRQAAIEAVRLKR